MKRNILDYDTVALDDGDNALVIIDQTLLPGRVELLRLRTAGEMREAVASLRVRGAPAIGVAAAYAIYLLAKGIDTEDFHEFYEKFRKYKQFLNSSRPTAVNLSWALDRMERALLDAHNADGGASILRIKEILRDEACNIQREDIEICRAIGVHGLSLVKPGDGILTHCNAGKLAASRYGTATAPIYLGHERGYGFRVYADETRPLLQGARLTAFELQSAGIDVTLICDDMSGTLMRQGRIDAVFVGCDRVAANGDVANKIGTCLVAAAARQYGVPFYVCAPTSTIDFDTAEGGDIVIEERDPSEVTEMWYRDAIAPAGVKVYNPAFDVTDAGLVTAIVTEYGVIRPPYAQSLAELREAHLRAASGRE